MAHALAERPAARRRAPSASAPAPGALVRARAADVLTQVLVRGQSLNTLLLPGESSAQFGLDARDLALLHELCFGVLRVLPRLDALIEQILQRPLKPRDQDLRCLLRLGLYQLDALALPAHAAVAATVAACDTLGKAWARGLLNASLRRFLREGAALHARIQDDPGVQSLLPLWLLDRLRAAWPEHWPELIAASNARAPMFLRVNRLRQTPAAYLQQLTAAGIAAEPVAGSAHALRLTTPMAMHSLPGFADGLVSVQDLGAQQAAALLDPQPGQTLLDACAAPGGKCAHLQELADNQLNLWALERHGERLVSLERTLARLRLNAEVRQADATAPHGDWAEQHYDGILLDAPCSGTGVMRRHPDIKWLRRDRDIDTLAQTQARLLDALWPLLKSGGALLYVTCSLLPTENEHQIAAFLARQTDAREAPLPADLGLQRPHGRQILPAIGGSDGFYFARLLKAC